MKNIEESMKNNTENADHEGSEKRATYKEPLTNNEDIT